MTYPYPEGEHMAVGAQINELQLLEEFKELTIENQLIDFLQLHRANFWSKVILIFSKFTLTQIQNFIDLWL